MNQESASRRLRIFLSTGETSGDIHASNLVRALRRLAPGVQCAALGGEALEAAGATLLHNMLGEFAVMGFRDALRVLPAIRRLRDDTLDRLDDWRPDAAVLVDYPGFNINLALHLKRRGIPVFYYICPQVWAWAPWRVHKIARRIDRALVVFEFEREFFARRGVPVEYVGHPLGDLFAERKLDGEFLDSWPGADAPFLVALLPGSRTREIAAGLPVKVEAALRMREALPDATFAIPLTSDRHAALAAKIAADGGLACEVLVGRTHEVMSRARFALATSGTATLELAHFGVPMVVLYRTTPTGLFFKRFLLTTPHIALANIVAGREIVPELVYWRNHADTIARLALDIITDPARLEATARAVREVGSRIDSPGASDTAARAILEGISERPRA